MIVMMSSKDVELDYATKGTILISSLVFISLSQFHKYFQILPLILPSAVLMDLVEKKSLNPGKVMVMIVTFPWTML